jgi:large subunit ribosomal protein L17
MRHHAANRKFGRERKVRRALLRSLAANLILRGKIETTEAKAKELRGYVEKLVTRGKSSTLASERILLERLGTMGPVKKLIKDVSPKYADRKGGYTRIVKTSPRAGDGSPMAIIEFV